MLEITPEEPPEQSAEALARSLMDAALADPTLTSRAHELPGSGLGAPSAGLPAAAPGPARSRLFQRTPLLARSATSQYLEELVSIAVTSAQRAEDLLHAVGKTARFGRRAIGTVVGIGALGILVGLMGIADKRLSDRSAARLTQVAGEMRALADLQQRTGGEVAQLQAQVAEEHVRPAKTSQDADVPASAQPAGPPASAPRMVSREGSLDASAAATPVATMPTQPFGKHPTPRTDSAIEQASAQTAQPSPADAAMSPNEGAQGSSGAAPQVADQRSATTDRAVSNPPPVDTAVASDAWQSLPTTSPPNAALPTQPFGVHPAVATEPLPAQPRHVAHVVRHAPTRGTVASRGSASSGNPVRDFRKFVVAVGDGVRSIFVR
jgi:hypothetical protein